MIIPDDITMCENGHIGPFVYESDEELIGPAYGQERNQFVTLTCQSCWTETQRLTVREVANLLNELVQLPKSKATK